MPISEQEAIAAARRVADAHGDPAWRHVTTGQHQVIAGHHCWSIIVTQGAAPDATEIEQWGQTDDWIEYFIDQDSGGCVGIGTLGGRHLFLSDSGLIDIVSLFQARRAKAVG